MLNKRNYMKKKYFWKKTFFDGSIQEIPRGTRLPLVQL